MYNIIYILDYFGILLILDIVTIMTEQTCQCHNLQASTQANAIKIKCVHVFVLDKIVFYKYDDLLNIH